MQRLKRQEPERTAKVCGCSGRSEKSGRKSAAAANETAEMIQSSIDKVEEGVKIADETAASLTKIVESLEMSWKSSAVLQRLPMNRQQP